LRHPDVLPLQAGSWQPVPAVKATQAAFGAVGI